MKVGVTTFMTDEGIRPAPLAKALEERGFDSLLVHDHSHVPVTQETPFPGGGELPRMYYRTLDPFVALTAAATVTDNLLLGTGVALLVQRDVIHTAKQIASLDLVSGGRVIFGVGSGWSREEMRNHGTDPRTRGALLNERLAAIKEIWTKEQAEFHGKYVDFDASYLRPKPVQKPHPPIYIGGDSDATVKRVIRHDAGWISNPLPVEHLGKRIAQLRAGAGHDVPLAQFGTPADHEYWHAVEDLGFGQVALMLPTKPLDESLRLLDEYAALVAQYRG